MRVFIIDKNSAGRRLFRYIKAVLPGAKNSEIFKLLRKKVITVNGKRAADDYCLQEGDEIKFFLRDELFKEQPKTKFSAVKMRLDVVYEDGSLLVVNKEPGVEVHAGSGDYSKSLLEGIKAYLYRKGEYDPASHFTPALCNRLDRNTSGLVVAAKSHRALQEMTAQFRERRTIKRYLAVVKGDVERKMLITSIIDDTPNSENKVKVSELKVLEEIPAKESLLAARPELSATLITPLRQGRGSTLVEVELWTGKKHQIRAHLKGAGYPLAGDRKYFTPESARSGRRLPRYFLHAWQLKVEGYSWWKAKLPGDMQKLLVESFSYKL